MSSQIQPTPGASADPAESPSPNRPTSDAPAGPTGVGASSRSLPDGSAPTRRVVLAGAGIAAIGAVAACSSSTDSGSGQGTAPDAPEGAPGTVLGPAAQIPVGGGAVFADQQVVVTQSAPGRYQGLSTVCPHQGCQVNSVRDGAVICPCHGSRFALDGAVLEGPAQAPLARRAVTVRGDNITLA